MTASPGSAVGLQSVSQNAGQTWQRAADAELPRLRKLSVREEDKALVAISDWGASALSREFESHDNGQNLE